MNKGYVLITAAHNEEKLIELCLRGVTAQTLLPMKWVIVSDCSTDRTEEIVRSHAEQHSFIELVCLTQQHARNFAAQVDAINAGYARVRNLAFAFISNLDADITIQPTYYESLLKKFENDPRLGLGGGFIQEDYGSGYEARRMNRVGSVPHGVQFFRRKCYEDIGGYIPLRYGGPDWVAEVLARQKGWGVRSFPELKAFHHRPTGTAESLLSYWFQQGRMDYSIGVLPSFEIAKCISRLGSNPVLFGAMARLGAFALSYCSKFPRLMPPSFIEYLRREQRARMRAALGLNL